MNHRCTSCRQPIVNGQAVIRSINFERVAYHIECARGRHVAIPAQRQPSAAPAQVRA